MADLGAQLSQLSPEQRQGIMVKAQQEANQQVMQNMMQQMVGACFDKCAGTSVSRFDSFEGIRRGACLTFALRDDSTG
jgi:hypothetical protein